MDSKSASTNTLHDYSPSLVIQAVVYVTLGINHFWHASTYVAFMPTHYLHPHALVLIAGAVEICGGLGLIFKQTRRFAAWGIVLMLLVYSDVHLFMASHPDRFPSVPTIGIYLRIPFQFVLIAWAWVYTRQPKTRAEILTPHA